MIGAAQFKISTPEVSILYTGDLNYVDSLIGEAAEPEECDLLVTEATYGTPIYSFPSRTKVYSDIVMWALDEVKHGRTPCFRVYATGKAQEIVKLFNKYTSVPVFSDYNINSVNEICNDGGFKLIWEASESEPAKRSEPLIYVTSRRHYVGGRFSEARATGWALRMRRLGVEAFPLSGHADFNQLSKFVEDTGAERVYVFTGFVNEFSEYLRRKGLEAGPLPSISQRELLEFT